MHGIYIITKHVEAAAMTTLRTELTLSIVASLGAGVPSSAFGSTGLFSGVVETGVGAGVTTGAVVGSGVGAGVSHGSDVGAGV